MGFTARRSLALAATALATVLSAPAMAQEGEDTAVSTADIIVTARRVEERLQDVPISITVFNQEQISNRNVVTAADLATYTPSLSVNQRYGPEKAAFAIRGFVQDGPTSPSVGVYFADVVAPRANGGTTSGNNAPVGSFMDLQNVQVLKGPQGTLFGRNTTGGAVLLVPNRPTDSLEGYVEGSIGDYSMRRLQGVLNVPLAETFKVRMAVDRQKRDGFMRNRSGIGPKDYNDINYFAARLGILAELTPDLENYTLATYSNSFSNGYAARLVGCNPAAATVGGGVFTALPACDQIARQEARGDSLLDVEVSNPDPFLKLRTWQVINTTTLKASDTLTIKNIASYSEFRERTSFSLNSDNFVSRFDPSLPFPASFNGIPFQYILLDPTPNGDNSAQSTFTEELQFQGGTSDGKLNWQAGAYIEISNPLGFSTGNTGILLSCTDPETLACTNPFGSGQISQSVTAFTFHSKGLYAQGTYKITPQLSVTGGIRYTWDYTKAVGEGVRISPQAGGGYIQTCNDVVRFNNGFDGNGRVIPLVVGNRSECRYETSTKSDKPTWQIGADFKPTDDTLLYAKYARGYRAGGLNLTAIGLEGWEPEKVDTYEIGAKASFRGAVNGYFNVAGFYNDFSNQQLVIGAISNVPGFSGANPVFNAGKSRMAGVEVDASAAFFDNALRFDVGYTYLDTKLKEIVLPEIPAGAPYGALRPSSFEGDPLALSPKNRVTVTGTYTLPLDESIGELSVGATFTYTSKQLFARATAADFQVLPATNLLNINVNWNNVMGSPIDAAFFMTNVTNEIYPVATGTAWESAGFENQLFGAPRMYGFRLRYTFGQ